MVGGDDTTEGDEATLAVEPGVERALQGSLDGRQGFVLLARREIEPRERFLAAVAALRGARRAAAAVYCH